MHLRSKLLTFVLATTTALAGAQTKAPAPAPKTPRVPAATMAAQLVHKTPTIYPPLLNLDGTVVLRATIDNGGRVVALEVVSGPNKLWKAAIDTVRGYSYRPYLIKGVPTKIETMVSVDFNALNH